MFAVINAV